MLSPVNCGPADAAQILLQLCSLSYDVVFFRGAFDFCQEEAVLITVQWTLCSLLTSWNIICRARSFTPSLFVGCKDLELSYDKRVIQILTFLCVLKKLDYIKVLMRLKNTPNFPVSCSSNDLPPHDREHAACARPYQCLMAEASLSAAVLHLNIHYLITSGNKNSLQFLLTYVICCIGKMHGFLKWAQKMNSCLLLNFEADPSSK